MGTLQNLGLKEGVNYLNVHSAMATMFSPLF